MYADSAVDGRAKTRGRLIEKLITYDADGNNGKREQHSPPWLHFESRVVSNGWKICHFTQVVKYQVAICKRRHMEPFNLH